MTRCIAVNTQTGVPCGARVLRKGEVLCRLHRRNTFLQFCLAVMRAPWRRG